MMTSATTHRATRRSVPAPSPRARSAAQPPHATDRDGPPQPLGPDSLTWKYFADLRTGLLGVWIGSIQNMYPELGAGVEDHSILLREPLQRVTRSVFPIMGVVYDGDRAADTGRRIRGYHDTIKGVDKKGRRYHALNPETFYWAHATFFMLIINTAEYFCGGLTEAEKRQLFAEHVQWYRMYGMSMRPVPASWEEFQEYWERVCNDELEINQATLDIFHIRIPKPKYVLMPDFLWHQMWAPARAFQNWVAAGVFSAPVREKAGMRWTPGDEVLLRLFGKAVQLAFGSLPDEIRLHPRAVSAYRRARGELPTDAPLVEAPKFAAPPKDRHALPMHYVPPSAQPKSLTARAGELLHATFSLVSPQRVSRGRAEVA
nr:oxygenase MpaB family protein [Mycobacteroides saopaulense]